MQNGRVEDESAPDAADPGRSNRAGRRGPRRGPGARLVDVARAAGVSPQTASNVLGDRTGFTADTRKRVLAAAAELNYSPNRAAQRLRSRRSRQLGLHMPADQLTVRNTWSISFLRAAIGAAEAASQQLVVFTNPVSERSVRGLLRAGVDGFVLCNVPEGDPRPRVFAEMGLPFTLMGRLDPDLPQCCVDIDNALAMVPLVDHLVERGHRRFAFLGYDRADYWDVDRLAGTRARLREHGLEIPEEWVVTVPGETASERIGAQLLSADRPDAVICSSDGLAMVAHGVMTRAGLRPGTDMALTGFDGLTLPVELDPPLTSVHLPIDEIAATMIDLLVRQIEGEPAPAKGLVVPTDLRLGGSG